MTKIENHFAEVLHSEPRFRELLSEWYSSSGKAAGYDLRAIANIESRPLHLLTPSSLKEGPRVLVAGSFHGEEPSGAWGILKFIMQHLNLSSRVNVSFLPLVNPTGFSAATRVNYLGQNPNAGFVRECGDGRPLSIEGKILLEHLAEIKEIARDGFISLHEDWEQDHTYMYSFEHADTPGTFTKSILSSLTEFFPMLPDGEWESGTVRNGVIFNLSDGSFEDRLFRSGVPLTACSETPGTMPAAQRIACIANVVRRFVEYFEETADVSNRNNQGASHN